MRMIMIWLFYCMLAIIVGGTLGYRHHDSTEHDANVKAYTSPSPRS